MYIYKFSLLRLQYVPEKQLTSVFRQYTGADPGRGESGLSHGQIFSTLEYFALTFLKILN